MVYVRSYHASGGIVLLEKYFYNIKPRCSNDRQFSMSVKRKIRNTKYEVVFARKFRSEETDKSHEALLQSVNDSVV